MNFVFQKKCAQYWPALKTLMNCGIFTLYTTGEKQYAYYAIRTLKMTNLLVIKKKEFKNLKI